MKSEKCAGCGHLELYEFIVIEGDCWRCPACGTLCLTTDSEPGASAPRGDGKMSKKCYIEKCYMNQQDSDCQLVEGPASCPSWAKEPLTTEQTPRAEVPCSDGLDTLFFMEKRLPHLLNIAEELLTWCIEEDKKGIYRDYLKKYRKEYEALTEKGD